MPLSDVRETAANALIRRVAGGSRASETTQCARHHSAKPAIRHRRARRRHGEGESGHHVITAANATGTTRGVQKYARCACSRDASCANRSESLSARSCSRHEGRWHWGCCSGCVPRIGFSSRETQRRDSWFAGPHFRGSPRQRVSTVDARGDYSRPARRRHADAPADHAHPHSGRWTVLLLGETVHRLPLCTFAFISKL
jgi:hypothetical protein